MATPVTLGPLPGVGGGTVKANAWGDSAAAELVLTIGSGASFGEIALMYESTNTITIKAHVDVTVWTIDRHTFRSIVVNSASKRRQQYEAIIAGVSLFESLSKPERAVMADALEDVVYPDGHAIMQQGEEGDYFCESRASRVQAAPSLDSASDRPQTSSRKARSLWW